MVKLLFLIDYDNLLENQKSNLQLYLEKVLSKVFEYIRTETYISGKVRLYGGWYENDTPTRDAVELDMCYQNALVGKIFKDDDICNYFIDVMLARSLLSLPEQDFWNTYRTRQNVSRGLKFEKGATGCNHPGSIIPEFRRLLKKGTCPHTDCDKNQNQLILFRSEQKMVDTMLSCDIIDSMLINPISEYVIVVSADDDFMPPLVLASTARNRQLIHVIPKNKRSQGVIGSDHNWIEWEVD